MKILINIIICLMIMVSLPLSAYAGVNFGTFEKGDVVFLYGDNVNIRNAPSTKGRKVGQLPIGACVTIVKKTSKLLTLHNFEAPWYQISFFNSKGMSVNGYIWGGLLAFEMIDKDFDGDGHPELVLIGVKGDKSQLEARLVSKRKIVSKLEFKSIDRDLSLKGFTYTFRAVLLEKKNFNPPVDLIKMSFEYGACDYTNGDVIIAVSDNKMKYCLEASFSTNEFGGSDIKYKFPGDEGGQENSIVVLKTTRETDETGENSKITASERKVYTWKNGKFVK